MKKLNSIKWVSIKKNVFYLEDTPVNIGVNIEDYLKEFNFIDYIIETTDYDENRECIRFISYPYIKISTYDKIIESVIVFPRVWENDSRCYQGEIFIFDKKLEVPFLSDDIEKYFPDIEIKPKGYWDRFTPHESVEYSVSNFAKIEISMSRLPKLVGSISLKKKNE